MCVYIQIQNSFDGIYKINLHYVCSSHKYLFYTCYGSSFKNIFYNVIIHTHFSLGSHL